jgi:hypothetical protein
MRNPPAPIGRCRVCGDPFSLRARDYPGYTCSDWCSAVQRGLDPRLEAHRRTAAIRDRRDLRQLLSKPARKILCQVCRKNYQPGPDERNVKTHPGSCRQILEEWRYARASERKRIRKEAVKKGSGSRSSTQKRVLQPRPRPNPD